jgi:16S rRNA G966 N2-methylase RsmD
MVVARELEVSSKTRAGLNVFSLKDRRYLGPTSMDHELSCIMCNHGHVRPGSLVLDPFAGTGSILVAAASYGARVLGCDIDLRVLRCGRCWTQVTNRSTQAARGLRACYLRIAPPRFSRLALRRSLSCVARHAVRCRNLLLLCLWLKTRKRVSHCSHPTSSVGLRDGKKDSAGTPCNVYTNFQDYGLPDPAGLIRCDASHSPWRPGLQGVFDAILCDPPYGVRAGACGRCMPTALQVGLAPQGRCMHTCMQAVQVGDNASARRLQPTTRRSGKRTIACVSGGQDTARHHAETS